MHEILQYCQCGIEDRQMIIVSKSSKLCQVHGLLLHYVRCLIIWLKCYHETCVLSGSNKLVSQIKASGSCLGFKRSDLPVIRVIGEQQKTVGHKMEKVVRHSLERVKSFDIRPSLDRRRSGFWGNKPTENPNSRINEEQGRSWATLSCPIPNVLRLSCGTLLLDKLEDFSLPYPHLDVFYDSRHTKTSKLECMCLFWTQVALIPKFCFIPCPALFRISFHFHACCNFALISWLVLSSVAAFERLPKFFRKRSFVDLLWEVFLQMWLQCC